MAASWSRVGTLEQCNLKQAVYSTFDPQNKQAWKHKSKGPKVHWERNLTTVLGDTWRTSAMDRVSWRHGRIHSMCTLGDALLGRNSKLFGVCYDPMPEKSPPKDTPETSSHICDLGDEGFGALFLQRGVAHAALLALRKGLHCQSF